MRKTLIATAMLTAMSVVPSLHAAEAKKPNILVIFGDDIGWQNVSAYGMGTMGYRTPNIDSIAQQGAMFTDHYAQPSSTAGRAAFITGQYPIRSGMTTVSMPGGSLGLKSASPSLAEVLKAQAMPPVSLAKTIWAITTSPCPRFTALTSSLAISTTSTPRKSPSSGITSALPKSTPALSKSTTRSSVPEACSTATPQRQTTRRSSRALARWANRSVPIRAH